MKTILAPTDFSEISLNAIDYAVEIAKCGQAKLILFNSYRLPVVTAETALLIPSIEELAQSSQEGLARIKKDIQNKHGNGLTIECVSSCGFAVEEIKRYAEQNNIGLMVVGMQGAGYLTERFFGSTTTSLIQEAGCPILSIDKHVRFKHPKKIVLASDYLETGNKDVLGPLRDFAKLFRSHVYVLNVITPSDVRPEVEETVNDYISFEDSLKDMEHTFHYIKDKDVVKGINDFVVQRQMDMIVMIPRRHSVFETLFNEPLTRKMAFHSSLPLLTLHA